MFWFGKKDQQIRRLEEKLRVAEAERDWAQEDALKYDQAACDAEFWKMLFEAESDRLRQRTHEISERLTKENGNLARELGRTRRALNASLMLLGANMDGRLRPIFRDGDEVRDRVRYIHGLVPESAFWTGLGYRVALTKPYEGPVNGFSTPPVLATDDVCVNCECDSRGAVA